MARRGFRCCWGCDFRWEDASPRRRVQALLYEHAVEAIEAVGQGYGAFTISDAWRAAMGRPVQIPGFLVADPSTRRPYDGPGLYPLVSHALHDLAEHGLAECLKYANGCARCLGWRLKSR